MSKFNACLRNGLVSFGDDFDIVAEVTHLFGLKATKLPYRASFNVPGKKNVIAWLPSEEGGRGWHNVPEYGPNTDSRGWNEILTISEYNDDPETTDTRIKEELAAPKTRYVFWRAERVGAKWYKAYGTFEIDADSTRVAAASEKPRVIYRRVSTTAECLKVDEMKTMFTDAEFVALKNRVVTIRLLDEIGFAANCDTPVAGRVTAWPGMKFLVTVVSSDLVHVTCGTKDEKLLDAVKQHVPAVTRDRFVGAVSFSIPRRDFELGYVGVLPGEGSLDDTFAARDEDDEGEEGA